MKAILMFYRDDCGYCDMAFRALKELESAHPEYAETFRKSRRTQDPSTQTSLIIMLRANFGFGSCVAACQFDAIHVVNGVAVVDKEKCVACGKCVEECPNHLIEMVPYDASYGVF